jgi:hypothetical protein
MDAVRTTVNTVFAVSVAEPDVVRSLQSREGNDNRRDIGMVTEEGRVRLKGTKGPGFGSQSQTSNPGVVDNSHKQDRLQDRPLLGLTQTSPVKHALDYIFRNGRCCRIDNTTPQMLGGATTYVHG